jgi:hypothetical protein
MAASVVSFKSCSADLRVILLRIPNAQGFANPSPEIFPAMKLSRSNSQSKGENTMKRMLLVLAAAVLFLNTLVVPTVVHADGVGGTNCGGKMCKP